MEIPTQPEDRDRAAQTARANPDYPPNENAESRLSGPVKIDGLTDAEEFTRTEVPNRAE
ncbi:hypothetical protein [Paenibacillus xerothermodurans]|uniref:hypothetical protein n=1 Tax=Paenibacillus xerothermodurans TaxID=1977292 RepID=UPI001402FDEE|nr:hypothetical protein [Paenibacillus xerothermodurans]